ncbi:MAG: hypothetical protein MJ117_00590 [Lachnospiraceae bacterium]|nr:hypothetical protein [Lachnospiraceae bacterium]
MIRCAIIYTATNNNTRRLAEVMSQAVRPGSCMYLGRPNPDALAADVIFWGNNSQDTSEETVSFYEKAKELNKILIPYGHTCFGGGKDMYAIGNWANQVMHNAEVYLREQENK